MKQRFSDKVVLVTGGSSGIGRATALAFAEEGAIVVIGDVEVEGSEETVRQIRGIGGQAMHVRADVSNASDVAGLVDICVETFGRLDIAFNNAGISGTSAPVAELSEESWNRVISVNLTGVWLCMKYEIAQMLKQGGGVIVNNSSILGVVGFASAAAYTAAKHGVIGLTQTAAIDYAERGIRVNAVCPGFIETPMLERAGLTTDPVLHQQIASLHPMNRLGTSREVADAVLWLCSDGSSFVTGHSLLVDGGYVIR